MFTLVINIMLLAFGLVLLCHGVLTDLDARYMADYRKRQRVEAMKATRVGSLIGRDCKNMTRGNKS